MLGTDRLDGMRGEWAEPDQAEWGHLRLEPAVGQMYADWVRPWSIGAGG